MRRLALASGRQPTVLALALLAAFAPASWSQSQTGESQTSLSTGLGLESGSSAGRSLFGQYNGLRSHDAVGLLDLDHWRHDSETGASVAFRASQLLLDTRELGLQWKVPGNWRFAADLGQLVHRDPHTVRSGLTGAGSTTPQVVAVTPGGGSELDLRIKRTNLGLAFAKVLSPRLQFDVSLSTENKEGARLFGRGMSCPSTVAPGCLPTTGAAVGAALLMLPEPISANHSQVEARLTYGGDKLRLSGGYRGSFYRNDHDSLRPSVPGSLNNAVGTLLPLNTGLQAILNQPMALWPDNEAHHLDLSGLYAFTPATRLNFKLGFARATQQQDFASGGFTGIPAGVSHLGGRVDTTSAQLSLSSRPLPRLSLLAELRWRDRDDRTPIVLYNVEGSATYTNRQLPNTRTRAKLQAGYQLTADVRGTLTLDAETIDRGVFTATSAVSGISALRQETDETGLRAELRRRMTDDVSASLTLESSRRRGSNWLKDNSGLGVTEVADPTDPGVGFATALFMPTLADRDRDKARLFADWQPSERLALQLSAEAGRDRYAAPSAYGVQRSRVELFAVEADYTLSTAWRMNAHASRGTQVLHQSRPGAAILSLDNDSLSLGLGVTGQVNAKLSVGGGLELIDDKSSVLQTLPATADAGSVALLAATGGLPDIVFRQTTLKLFARHELSKRAALRLDLLHQRSRWTDWAWGHDGVPFAFSDGTTVYRKPVQNVGFVAITYTHRWP
jgi:MtrB/PioB family decaheme-associated outer membrane protein